MKLITLNQTQDKPTLGSTKLMTYSSTKMEHSNEYSNEYLVEVMYLSPSDKSGWNVCQKASEACKRECLDTAGRGRFDNVQNARLKRTNVFFLNREEFFNQLVKEIDKHVKKSRKLGLKPAVRLNGTSDLPWEKIKIWGFDNIMTLFREVDFYDYSKISYDKRPSHKLPDNYNLTFSRSEDTTLDEIEYNLANGRNVAVVFDTVPDSWLGMTVINGDTHDLRMTDPKGVIVGLKAKGKAKKDTSGFVVRLNS